MQLVPLTLTAPYFPSLLPACPFTLRLSFLQWWLNFIQPDPPPFLYLCVCVKSSTPLINWRVYKDQPRVWQDSEAPTLLPTTTTPPPPTWSSWWVIVARPRFHSILRILVIKVVLVVTWQTGKLLYILYRFLSKAIDLRYTLRSSFGVHELQIITTLCEVVVYSWTPSYLCSFLP